MSSEEKSWKDLLKELVDCEDRKERKKLVKAVEAAVKDRLSAADKDSNGDEAEGEVENGGKKAEGKGKSTKADSVDVKAPKTPSTKESVKEKSKKARDEDSEIERNETRTTDTGKKKRTSQAVEDAPVASKKARSEEEEQANEDNQPTSEKKRFQRVDEEKALQQALIADNRYEAVFGQDGYGAKANEKLKTVRGKDFRHEKTKKKRGSYRGGAIDESAVNSVEFDSD